LVLTVNGTSGTAATALAVSQPGAAAGITIASANNTATNGLSFSGTFTNLINSTNFTVSNAGAITAVGVNSGTGLLQGTGGLTVTGATSINASGANTTNIGTGTNTGAINIGNASAGALALQSGAGVTVTGGAASSFTTTSGNLTVDSVAVLNLGNTSATSITLGRTGVTTTNAGALTVSQLLTGSLGATISGAAISFNDNSNFNTTINTGSSTGTVSIGNATSGAIALQSGAAINTTAGAASTISTTAGALTITSAAAATWSTTAGNLTLQAGSGTVSLGTSTALTASGALGITSGGANALTLDTGGAATLSVGTANANAVSISRTGITTTVNGNLTVAETVNLNGNTTIGDATTDRLTVTSQLLGQDALVFQGATDDSFTTTLRVTNPTANNILTLPNETGTICTTGSVCTGYAPSATNGYVQFAPASAQTDATNNSSVFINKTSGTGNILQLQRAGNDALVVANNGYVGLGGSATNRLAVTDTQTANSGYVAAQNISQTFTPTSTNYTTWAMGMNITTSLDAGTTVSSSDINSNIRGLYAEAANFSGQNIYASYGVTGASGIGSGAGGTIGNAYGTQGYIYQNGAGTITNAFPVFSEVRSTGAGQIINATGFYGDLSVTAGTVGEYTLLKAADYSSIVGANQFGVITYGKSRFGDNTLPTEVLEVAGNISVTAANSYKIGGVIAMEASGGYLRLNQSNQFAQGIYTGTSGVRVGGTTGILVGSIGADGQIGIIPNGVDTTRRITLDGGTGAITSIGVNSGTGLVQGTGGLTITGTTNINTSGANATNIGTGTNTGTIGIGSATAGAISIQSAGAVNTTAGAASTISTTAGALTLTSATAATWSTTAGNLTLQAGSGTVSLGTSTALTASGALGITSGGANALTLDTGGAATLSVGTTNANALSISRSGITTTVNGVLTVAENTNLNGNTTIGNATTDRLTVTSQILGGSPLVFQGVTDNGFATTFAITDPTANNTITFPDASGTVQLALLVLAMA
jgi:hypothetical protein